MPTKKEKKPVLLKTKEERLTEIIEVIKKLNNLGLNDTIPGIKEFKTYQKFGEKVYKIRENVLKNLSLTFLMST